MKFTTVFFHCTGKTNVSLDTIFTNQRLQGKTSRRLFVLDANLIYICRIYISDRAM